MKTNPILKLAEGLTVIHVLNKTFRHYPYNGTRAVLECYIEKQPCDLFIPYTSPLYRELVNVLKQDFNWFEIIKTGTGFETKYKCFLEGDNLEMKRRNSEYKIIKSNSGVLYYEVI